MHEEHFKTSLKAAIWLTSLFFLVELAGGLLSGSLSLLGDAAHMLRDILALVASLSALNIAGRLPTKMRTFGFHRVEVLAAFLNGLLLLGIGFWVLWEAYHRFRNPGPIHSMTMLAVAAVGLGVNVFIAFRLHGSRDLNIRSAFFHVLTDALVSLGVILAAVLIAWTGDPRFDPGLSAAISVVIMVSALAVIKDSVRILLEFAPEDVDFDRMMDDILSVEGVSDVHNVHLWSLCSSVNILDAHVLTTMRDITAVEKIKAEIKQRLQQYHIRHATLEFECESCPLTGAVERLEH